MMPSHFSIRERDIPALMEGQVLVKPLAFFDRTGTAWHGHRPTRVFFCRKHELGSALTGPAVARVVESRHGNYAKGMLVSGWLPWGGLPRVAIRE